MRKVLVLAPHTDDETLGCGGFINRLYTDEVEVIIVAFSTCGLTELRYEFEKACKTLHPECVFDILNYKVRYFDRQEVLNRLILLRDKYDPDTVICPASFDIHQDHQVVHNEAVRAFKDRTILGYCNDWNIVGPSHFQFKVELTSREHQVRFDAMRCYESQKERPYFRIFDWMNTYEKFEVIAWKY